MVTKSTYYKLIEGQLYKIGVDGILHRRVLEYDQHDILYEEHERIVGVDYAGNATVYKLLCMGLCCLSLLEDA